MREILLEKLAYPRELVRNYQDLDQCPHSGMFDRNDVACLECEDRSECEWLYSNNEYSNLHLKPLPELVQALAFALDFVSAQVALWEHEIKECQCETCVWYREAVKVYDEAANA